MVFDIRADNSQIGYLRQKPSIVLQKKKAEMLVVSFASTCSCNLVNLLHRFNNILQRVSFSKRFSFHFMLEYL